MYHTQSLTYLSRVLGLGGSRVGPELLFLLAPMNVAEGSHVDSLEVALRQVASQIPKYILRFLRL